MRSPLFVLIGLATAFSIPAISHAATAQDLARKFKQLPTVPEAELPKLSNELGPFRGVVKHEGLEGHTWVTFPFVENAASLDVDPKGRIFVTEANRFWLGVPDLRGANEMIRDDFKAVTIADRLALYEKFKTHFPENWFTAVADRVIRLEDSDGNGAPDRRTLFSDRFKAAEDGIGFSVLAERDEVYFTCIPKLWKLTDSDDDGKADNHEAIAGDFGIRVSFIGHDLHGIVRGPDGRLYFSVGDRGYHVKTADGKVHDSEGRGAVFRCESDGSGLELFADGLRNPEELGFDDFGNLFTFDNTGDIGDKARMVYVLEGTDSGWNMAHQSPHQYAKALDWGDFRPARAVWVAEKMYDLWHEAQPQWVYPPVAHVGNGPSGFTFLTGHAIPEDLRGRFLLTNYSGASEASSTLLVSFESKGAGFASSGVKELVRGIGATDVALGYDGRLFLTDFGGGWSVNTNASVQVLQSKDEKLRQEGVKVAKLVASGLAALTSDALKELLSHPDRRLRQEAQFELVKRGNRELLSKATASGESRFARLHALWGLGQLKAADALIKLTSDADVEIRANAVRALGDLRSKPSRPALLGLLRDDSPRVRSLAAVALGRVSEAGDAQAIEALYAANVTPTDVVLRHAILSALDRIGTAESATARTSAADKEQRLLAVLFLRRHASPQLAAFLSDADTQVRHEVIRAIYDSAALDSPAGAALAGLNPTNLPEGLQRRIVAANYRLGRAENARRLVELTAINSLPLSVREYALHGLEVWTASIDTDPVLGHYRPQVVKERTREQLSRELGATLTAFLSQKHDGKLIALGTRLANDLGIQLDEGTLRRQVKDTSLAAAVRVASLDSLIKLAKPEDKAVVTALLKDASPEVKAAAIRHGFALKLEGIEAIAQLEIQRGPLVTARASITGLPVDAVASLWVDRNTAVRSELWLDVFLRLQSSDHAALKNFTDLPQTLAGYGGDSLRGETVFRNQGGCLQCHLMNGEGSVQGPDLTTVAERLKTDKLLESLIHPNAVIAEGYGMSSATLKNGTALVGRLAKQSPDEVLLIGLDGKQTALKRADIASLTPPMSAMPPMALALPLPDLRDLVAYLTTRTQANAKRQDKADHGESKDAKIAK
jgi:quinoprotein glucose dehydrogenase